MSFQDDIDDRDPIVFTRPATTIRITGPGDEPIETIDLPELHLRRSEVSPDWLAAHDAEQAEKHQDQPPEQPAPTNQPAPWGSFPWGSRQWGAAEADAEPEEQSE